jgi:eukaryotic-like serine/threonine-protein kinase
VALALGTRLGPYEITALIGVGGMGEVYRATDANLARQVAIKVLPDELATDNERLARFDREGKTLGALNHPNIATVYGVERSHRSAALVMELVEGPTLAARIAEGPLRAEDALPIALQMSDALEAAHEQGIIHRDLKPANIKLRLDGTVKVLDFGLAKVMELTVATSPGVPPSALTAPAKTGAGMILGTPAYMSPEQARGKPVDERADIWAFGCVLYEMLTGKRAFEGEDDTSTLARVIEREPDYALVSPGTPSSLRRILQRCLAKNPKSRYRSMGDVRLDLTEALDEPTAGGASDAAKDSRRKWSTRAAWSMAAVLAVAALALLAERQRTDVGAPAQRVEFTVLFGGAIDDEVALSPDGRYVVAEIQGKGLAVRDLSAATVRFVAGSDGDATTPTVSPDGRWIAYVDQVSKELRRIAADGGQPITILRNIGGSYGMAWGPDDSIIFVTSGDPGLRRVAATGGAVEALTEIDRARQEIAHWLPEFLPGGRRILFTVPRTSIENTSVEVFDLDTRERSVLVTGGYHGRYLHSGHLAFMRGEALWAVPFDAEALRVTGEPEPVLEGVALNAAEFRGAFAISQNGTLVYLKAGAWEQESTMVWVDRSGVETSALAEPGQYFSPRLSPDGNRLAFRRIARGSNDVWVTDLAETGNLVRVTADEADTQLFRPSGGAGINGVVWTPNGAELVYALATPWDTLHRQRWQTGEASVRIHETTADERPSSVSPDGRLLVYDRLIANSEIWVLPLDGSDAPRALRATSYDQRSAAISPDGRWIAYESEETGRSEVWLESFDAGAGARRQVSRGGGQTPRWSGRGELFYRVDRAMMSVLVDLPTGAPGRSVELFKGDYLGFGLYDVSSDGERFVMIKPLPGEEGAREITVVVDWLEELKRAATTE